ncbi:hypothetical protein LSAT2_008569 [Lamellibrachia satsuma]|nr:hypothetical protein LSAT2_008569 [Lamellibrachia satsuma]
MVGGNSLSGRNKLSDESSTPQETRGGYTRDKQKRHTRRESPVKHTSVYRLQSVRSLYYYHGQPQRQTDSQKTSAMATHDVVCVLSLLSIALVALTPRALAASHGHETSAAPKRCSCDVLVGAGRVAYHVDELSVSLGNAASCRQARHVCRHECAKMAADLSKPVIQQESLGYKLCDEYGRPTSGEGLDVTTQAKVSGCVHKPIRQSRSVEKLCCGHTIVTLAGGKVIKAFGWNPDCMSMRYILG